MASKREMTRTQRVDESPGNNVEELNRQDLDRLY